MNKLTIRISNEVEGNVHGEAVEAVKVTLLRDGSFVDEATAVMPRGLADAVRSLRRQQWQRRCALRTARQELSAAFMTACGLDKNEQEDRLWRLETARAKGRHAYRASKGIPAAAVLAGGIQGVK